MTQAARPPARWEAVDAVHYTGLMFPQRGLSDYLEGAIMELADSRPREPGLVTLRSSPTSHRPSLAIPENTRSLRKG
jgi:hypothetical protein